MHVTISSLILSALWSECKNYHGLRRIVWGSPSSAGSLGRGVNAQPRGRRDDGLPVRVRNLDSVPRSGLPLAMLELAGHQDLVHTRRGWRGLDVIDRLHVLQYAHYAVRVVPGQIGLDQVSGDQLRLARGRPHGPEDVVGQLLELSRLEAERIGNG